MKHRKETNLNKYMNRKNFKAVASFEDSTGLKCIDLIQTEENFFTFKTFRKDPEDPMAGSHMATRVNFTQQKKKPLKPPRKS